MLYALRGGIYRQHALDVVDDLPRKHLECRRCHPCCAVLDCSVHQDTLKYMEQTAARVGERKREMASLGMRELSNREGKPEEQLPICLSRCAFSVTGAFCSS